MELNMQKFLLGIKMWRKLVAPKNVRALTKILFNHAPNFKFLSATPWY